MKTKRNIFQICLLVSVLLALPAVAQAQLTYTTNNGAITITGYIGNPTVLNIPSSTNGYPVTCIGDDAFYDSSLTSVTIPNSITNIGEGAFEDCDSLTAITVDLGNPIYISVAGVLFNTNRTTLIQYPAGNAATSYTIPNGVTNIMADAFEDSTPTSITIPNSITNIGAEAFQYCSLTNITIPNSVTSIGADAFVDCVDLASVTIGTNVANIEAEAFIDCDLTSVTIPNSVTNIGYGAFACYSLNTITLDIPNSFYTNVNGVLFNKNQTMLIQYPGAVVGGYTISNSVTSIGIEAFDYCTLNNVMIPISVTNIGYEAFDNCENLTDVSIPNSVIGIGYGPFDACTSLNTITVDASNPAYSSLNGVLLNKSQTILIQYPAGNARTSYAITNSVISIGDEAFDICENLTNVTIPNSVTSIGNEVFQNCSLVNVIIPDSVTSIGQYAFSGCFNLTSITIPNSVGNFGNYTYVFAGCNSLTGAYFEGNAPIADSTMFAGDNNATVYYLPGTSGWSSTFGGIPTAPWTLPYPLILGSANGSSSLGVQNNQFGFTVSWATNLSVVVQASTNLVNPGWTPVTTNTLSGGTLYFSDAKWTNYHGRFYRLSAP